MASIVFYELDRKLPAQEAKLLIDKICCLINETPSHFQVGFCDYRRKWRGPTYNMFEKAVSNGDFDDYSYLVAVNYFTKENKSNCSLSVGVFGEPYKRMFGIHLKSEKAVSVSMEEILQLVIAHINPQYGIMYSMKIFEGPTAFMSGIWYSGMPDIMGRLSSEFSNEHRLRKKFSQGFFRDVFPWSYLTSAHLDKEIEGVRFQDWVDAPRRRQHWLTRPKTRGALSLLPNGCAVWRLTMEEAMEVRPRMQTAGLLMVLS